jgi:hypothetical protein
MNKFLKTDVRTNKEEKKWNYLWFVSDILNIFFLEPNFASAIPKIMYKNKI